MKPENRKSMISNRFIEIGFVPQPKPQPVEKPDAARSRARAGRRKALQKSEKPLAKAEQYQLMRKFSLRQRTGSETEQQAFVRFMERDPYAKQLYRQYTETRGVSVPTVAKAADSEPDESDHMRKLHEIADKIREKYPEQHLTKSAAITLAIQTPAGAQAYLADKQTRGIA